jgi:glutamate decarboxylase
MSTDVDELKRQIESLRNELRKVQQEHEASLARANQPSPYFSEVDLQGLSSTAGIPQHGMPAKAARALIEDHHAVDFNQRLNTSSYVNVEFEPEEEAVALMGLRINLADQTVYPQSYKLHDSVVNMIARLWNCPEPENFSEYGVYAGAGTVGSTEACLLAGIALKFRWREWYRARTGETESQVRAIRPNVVISSCYQAAWEKLFKYLDVEPRLIFPKRDDFTLDAEQIREAVDENTMGVVCIMGNHYGGQYDPVWDVDRVVGEINEEKGYQVGIHVDAASGGFIAPFQDLPAWDFRLNNVLSISSSGHKYGESCCGTGWVVWRQRQDLSEHVAISVTYLGGNAESFTLNFSRPASGVYVQYYKLMRYGIEGYQQVCNKMMKNAQYIREGLRAMTFEGKPRFIFLDAGDDGCLPVVAAALNPECDFTYDDIDLQNALSQHHWYVSGYKMGFNHPITEENIPLFSDTDRNDTMFRIVVKNNLTRGMADNLLESFVETFKFLDAVDFSGLHGFDTMHLRHKDQRKVTSHC